MLMLLKLTTAFSFLCLCQSKFCDYYWRDYDGENIPSDAIQAGTHLDKPYYVGQAYFREKELLPATIFDPSTGKEPVASAYNQVLEAHQNVKILCSPTKENFKWIKTESKKLHLMEDTHFVIGGSEVGQQLYIGRVFHDDETVMGKIFQHSQSNRGLWIPTRRGHEKNFKSYEVLTFICGQILDERFGNDDDGNDDKLLFVPSS